MIGRRFVDLHTHTTASDGSLAPTELIALADRLKLAAIAVTDHDTTAGLAPARAAAETCPELAFIPGVEVSATFAGGTMHLLGLGVDANSAKLTQMLDLLATGRLERNPAIIAKLNALGLELTMEAVVAFAEPAGILSRNHIAQAMVQRGHVASRTEAFDRYLTSDGPAYVSRTKLDPAETIAAIRDAGGLAVLAHPKQLNCENAAQLERIMRELMEAGLEAIEVYHSDCDPVRVRQYLDLTRKLGLVAIGGSDFHGRGKPDVELGRPRVPLSLLPDNLIPRLAR